MNILIIGSGGREHAILKKLQKSKKAMSLHAIPGSCAWEGVVSNLKIGMRDHDEIKKYVDKNKIEYVIIGPENPLCAGLTDLLEEINVKVFGPSKYCSQLEKDKAISKNWMNKYNIPTSKSNVYSDLDSFTKFIKSNYDYPCVLKSVNLAGGKGVVLANSEKESLDYAKAILEDNLYGENNKLLVEEFLVGLEYSLLCLVRGKDVWAFPPVQDYKRIYDDNKGPNTGGMGVSTIIPNLSEEEVQLAIDLCIKPLCEGLLKDGKPYNGILFAGIMQTQQGPKVIEYNIRFGDPECEILLLLLENDLGQLLDDFFNKKDLKLSFVKTPHIGVVLAAPGYPHEYQKNIPLTISEEEKEYTVFMGVRHADGQYFSNGGRALFVYSTGQNLNDAYNNVYMRIKKNQSWQKLIYRNDIGKGN